MASSPYPLPASRLSRQTFDSSCSPPPPLPPDSVYTSCYCEENIYLLAQNFLAEAHTQTSRGLAWPWEIYVVFISNRGKTVALWSQKLRAPQVVVWDYHVVLVLRPAASIPDIKSHGNLHGDREQLKTCAQVSGSSPHVGPRVTQVPATNSEECGPEDPKLPTETFNIDLGHAEPFNAGWVYDFDTTLDVPCPCIGSSIDAIASAGRATPTGVPPGPRVPSESSLAMTPDCGGSQFATPNTHHYAQTSFTPPRFFFWKRGIVQNGPP
uniref:Protein N-terminal glutamine amidohydrolase n=1 Tax=Ganoderma boninense TaxID=34458 RepID=A0A5K1K4G0_9APHY|nr:Mitogen-activated protein kinase (EC [Ganoderma boninense]